MYVIVHVGYACGIIAGWLGVDIIIGGEPASRPSAIFSINSW